MAPRFSLRASKFRHLECAAAPREAAYDQLQISPARADGNAAAAARDRFAFAHQVDGGAGIQIKALSETGKETNATPPLLRAHQGVVNALDFSPFDPALLLSASADATVKIWKLPGGDPSLTADMRTPAVSFTHDAASVAMVAARWNPSTSGIAAAISRRAALVLDIEAETVIFEWAAASDATQLAGMSWNYEGSLVIATALDGKVHLLDPRAPSHIAGEIQAHQAPRRPTNVVWCGQRGWLLTTGNNAIQERELKLWDPRNLSVVLHRERLDSGIGALVPLYDPDLDLLYVLGRGDRNVRSFEVDRTARVPLQALDNSVLPHMTSSAALLPKGSCDTFKCEVARVLNLSASDGVVDVLRFVVPRKQSAVEFQCDLYPDTSSSKPALTASEWRAGATARPLLERVVPTSPPQPVGLSTVEWKTAVSATTTATANASPAGWGMAWNTAATSSQQASGASSTASGWASKATAWNAAPTVAQAPPPPQWTTPSAVASSVQPSESESTDTGSAALPSSRTASAAAPEAKAEVEPPREDEELLVDTAGIFEVSAGARQLGNTRGHKLKYIAGREATRNQVFSLGDKRPNFSAVAPTLKANDRYWAVAVEGAGGSVLVQPREATGKATTETPVLRGHKAPVIDMDFHPFASDILATGSDDSSINIWKLDQAVTESLEPSCQLRGHTRGIRSVLFNPAASDVLCTSSQDLTIRLWDVEQGAERICLSGKLEDTVWNTAFSPDGSLLAAMTRAKILRVFDPRNASQALHDMGCGVDSVNPQYVTWISPTHLLTIGTDAQRTTQVQLWDARSLIDPLLSTNVACSAMTTPFPFFDESSRALFLVELGGRNVWSCEFDPATMSVLDNLPFLVDGLETISGAALLPKSLCDVRQVEVDRLLLLRGGSTVQQVSFSLPRADQLKQYFQDDVFGPVRSPASALPCAQWFAGDPVVLQYDSLCPADMTPLSSKPIDTRPRASKSVAYKQQWLKEEQDKQLRAEQYERLQTLAAQPSLHGKYQPKHAATSDSDDDWDD